MKRLKNQAIHTVNYVKSFVKDLKSLNTWDWDILTCNYDNHDPVIKNWFCMEFDNLLNFEGRTKERQMRDRAWLQQLLNLEHDGRTFDFNELLFFLNYQEKLLINEANKEELTPVVHRYKRILSWGMPQVFNKYLNFLQKNKVAILKNNLTNNLVLPTYYKFLDIKNFANIYILPGQNLNTITYFSVFDRNTGVQSVKARIIFHLSFLDTSVIGFNILFCQTFSSFFIGIGAFSCYCELDYPREFTDLIEKIIRKIKKEDSDKKIVVECRNIGIRFFNNSHFSRRIIENGKNPIYLSQSKQA